MGGTARSQMSVDVYDLARQGQTLSGALQLLECPRVLALREVPDVAQATRLGADAALQEIDWKAEFYRVEAAGQHPQSWLRLSFSTRLLQKCVRCLEPVAVAIGQTREFVFVGSEERAAELDEELDSVDVLVGSKRFDLAELIEDELILALPALPQHERCDLPGQIEEPEQAEEAPRRPFDMLKSVDWNGKGGDKKH